MSTDELEKLLADATPLPWRQGQPDSRKVHPHWRDSDGNDRDDCLHKNGWAKTIATVGKEEGDWRDALRQHADAALIVAAVNALPELLAMARRVEGLDRIERNRDMWKGQCERQAERLTVLNRAVSEISRGVQSGVDPQV